MTYRELKEIIEKNNIPEDVVICSNSGWECGATDVEAVYYSASKNEIHLTQKLDGQDYDEDSLLEDDKKAHDWVLLSLAETQ